MQTTDRTQRIAKNSMLLYARMLIAMFIGFYISRVLLNELGVEDYGIYGVVGGLVGMFTLLNMSMANTSIRFITVALGKGDFNEQKQVFSNALTIHVLLAFLIVVLAEAFGLWFLKLEMTIPAERMEAAIWVFHCSISAIFFSVINVPYNAMIGAYERMHIYAYFSLTDLFLRLAVVLAIPYFGADNLKVYALLLLGIQVLMQAVYWQYCYRHFKESRTGMAWDKSKAKEMFSFAGWSLFGDASSMLSSHGLNILLNIFFGPVINAARGVAVQVQTVLNRFTGSFQAAMNPQLIKSYADNDFAYMHKLLFAGSKFSFFFFLLLALPVFFEARQLLVWWLKIVPEHTVTFLRIVLLISLVECLANPLITSVKATGKIRRYQVILGSFLLLIAPLSYVFLKLGCPAYTVFLVQFVMLCIAHYLRVQFVKPLIQLRGRDYWQQVMIKVLVVFMIAPILPTLIYMQLDESLWRLLLICLTTLLVVPAGVWSFGVNEREKELIVEQVKKRFARD
ncbi:oligosaccharide flippase family protein [Sphingobacterium gobiense]|uniref:Lipopolysaccharide biosynthesis protein n=1 Tax=Sphingobacterium gobiense TaxID=1382456 RepID=A0A2S9JTD1_9SPHI|nr:oligosaccharide flippase family protein [Sphingobacterium gobiense]PRD56493.1 hypothetical protein C5749_04420 [Sphingobacterium gobiense]